MKLNFNMLFYAKIEHLSSDTWSNVTNDSEWNHAVLGMHIVETYYNTGYGKGLLTPKVFRIWQKGSERDIPEPLTPSFWGLNLFYTSDQFVAWMPNP